MKRWFLLPFIIFDLAANATNYYISSSGNDANDGTSTSTPWKTLTKVNTTTFSAGDQILFKRGDTWEGGLVVSSAGSAGNPIIFGAYGTGAKPIITRKIILPGWTTSGNWTNTGSNSWSINLNVPQWPRLWLNGTEQSRSQTSWGVNSTSRYFYNTNTDRLYVYATSNPSSFYSLMEIPTSGSSYAVRISNSKNYLTLQNLDIRGGQISVLIEWSNNIIIEDCDIGLDCAFTGVRSDNADNVTIRRCTVDSGDRILDTWGYALLPTSLQDGIRVGSNCDGWKIYQNTIKDWGHTNILFTNYTGGTMNNHEVYENYVTAVDVDYCAPISFEVPVGGGSATGNKIYRNFFDRNKGYCILNCPGLVFMYNIVNGNTKPSWSTSKIAHGVGINGFNGLNASDMTVVNNIFSNNEEAGLYMARHNGQEELTDNIIANNIFFNNGTNPYAGTNAGIQFTSVEVDAHGPNTFQNNLFFKSGVTNLIINRGTTQTIAAFNASNGSDGDVISNNIGGDPLFTNGTTDFTLQAGSPAKNAGVNLGAGYETGLNTGSLWPLSVLTSLQVGSWDIGAFVYIPNAPPVANAGNDINLTLPTIIANLNGSATDADGTIANYSWSHVSGPATFTFGSANAATTTLNNLVLGTYVFRLTVTDNGGATATDDVTVTVNVVPQCSNTAAQSAGSLINDNSIGAFNFSSPGNAATSDNSSASASAIITILSGNTNYLKATGFSFALPSTASICGIMVEVEKSASNISLLATVTDNSVRLVKAGNITGNDYATATDWSSTESYFSYGGSSDLWGTTWTPAEINANNFGVAFSARITGLVALIPSARIDHIRMTVYYNIVLPVQLTNFSARVQDDHANLLQWTIHDNDDEVLFTVQRSNDSKEWEDVQTLTGEINPVGKTYRFMDTCSYALAYYRILIMHRDGSINYSAIARISRLATNIILSIYPNPANNYLLIDYPEKLYKIVCISANGQAYAVRFQKSGGTNYTGDIRHLPKGIYIIRLNAKSRMFVKQ